MILVFQSQTKLSLQTLTAKINGLVQINFDWLRAYVVITDLHGMHTGNFDLLVRKDDRRNKRNISLQTGQGGRDLVEKCHTKANGLQIGLSLGLTCSHLLTLAIM